MTEERFHELEDLYRSLGRFPEWISFDCYGTLIDWDLGILDYVRRLLLKKGTPRPAGEILKTWEPIQFQMIQRPWQSYRKILYQSLYETFLQLGIPWRPSDSLGFADSMAAWKPFPEVRAALARLKRIARLAVISNTDEDILQQTLVRLGIPFDLVVSAEAAGAYKPSPEIFDLALREMKVEPERCLHAAFGLEYDIGPARELGFRTCLVNRSGRPSPVTTDYHVRDLGWLAETLGA